MRCLCKAINKFPPQPSDNDHRQKAIFQGSKKWVSGTILTYSFLDSRYNAYMLAVTNAFREWSRWANLKFVEVPKNGQIRIGFNPSGGSWSYLGRDILHVSQQEPTMNIGWSPVTDSNVALHEIGHTLGLWHEHFKINDNEWDKLNVYRDLQGPPNNWSKATIDNNLFQSSPPDAIGPLIRDDNCIMMYDIPASWLKSRGAIHPQGGLSALDKQWASIVYPSLDTEEPLQEIITKIETTAYLKGQQQLSTKFYVPKKGKYRVGTRGKSDTVCVLFSKASGQIGADDDSGEDRNAMIETELEPNEEYELVTRMYYNNSPSQQITIYGEWIG